VTLIGVGISVVSLYLFLLEMRVGALERELRRRDEAERRARLAALRGE